MLFFTACHYERVSARGGTATERAQAQIDATQALDPEWRNGFYIITGMTLTLRDEVTKAVKRQNGAT